MVLLRIFSLAPRFGPTTMPPTAAMTIPHMHPCSRSHQHTPTTYRQTRYRICIYVTYTFNPLVRSPSPLLAPCATSSFRIVPCIKYVLPCRPKQPRAPPPPHAHPDRSAPFLHQPPQACGQSPTETSTAHMLAGHTPRVRAPRLSSSQMSPLSGAIPPSLPSSRAHFPTGRLPSP